MWQLQFDADSNSSATLYERTISELDLSSDAKWVEVCKFQWSTNGPDGALSPPLATDEGTLCSGTLARLADASASVWSFVIADAAGHTQRSFYSVRRAPSSQKSFWQNYGQIIMIVTLVVAQVGLKAFSASKKGKQWENAGREAALARERAAAAPPAAAGTESRASSSGNQSNEAETESKKSQ